MTGRLALPMDSKMDAPTRTAIGRTAVRTLTISPWQAAPMRLPAVLLCSTLLYAMCLQCIMLPGTAAAQETAGNWTAFQNGGNLQVAGPLPTHWSAEDLAWQAKISGYGQSTPVISDGQVVVTSTQGANKDQYLLSAFDLATGEPLWQQRYANPSPEENTTYVSRAAPTPLADARGMLAFFEGGLVVAVDQHGELRWSRNLVEEFGPITARHGLGASPEQNEQLAFVWVERSEDPYLIAMNKDTGQTVWKTPGLGASGWSSLRLLDVGEEQHLLCSASGKIMGVDPSSGERLWEFTEIANNSTCTPVPVANSQFLIGASDGRGEENAGQGAASNGVIQIKVKDDRFVADFLWRAKKATCSFGSPAIFDGSAYLVNRVGVLYRLDLKTGQQLSVQRIGAGSIWATPLIADQKLFLFGQHGVTSVIDLQTHSEVAKNSLWSAQADNGAGEQAAFGGPVLYGAAAAAPYLVLRRGDRLYAVKAEFTRSKH